MVNYIGEVAILCMKISLYVIVYYKYGDWIEMMLIHRNVVYKESLYAIVYASVAEVRFSPVLQGIFLNREPEPNGRGTTGRTKNRTC